MTLELLNKAQLQIINRKNLRYPLDVAEKDYLLALVSRIVYESGLKDSLVFKGGTALHHTYLPQMRFSEDPDFTATSSVTLENLAEKIRAASDRDRYRDFYDIAMILQHHPVDREEILDLVRKEEQLIVDGKGEKVAAEFFGLGNSMTKASRLPTPGKVMEPLPTASR